MQRPFCNLWITFLSEYVMFFGIHVESPVLFHVPGKKKIASAWPKYFKDLGENGANKYIKVTSSTDKLQPSSHLELQYWTGTNFTSGVSNTSKRSNKIMTKRKIITFPMCVSDYFNLIGSSGHRRPAKMYKLLHIIFILSSIFPVCPQRPTSNL